ncbi:Ig-like domain repeat protein [Microbacterium sp. M3]|uniref:Ig-like domain repeat protein n=1 Tax=Microbacterium arthrosphaerae TaxID=792652 RepID=A0ABU4GXC8_9MICO|nr:MULTISPECIES: Ig-like domain repeat protein [Microbacterium]MDW4571735.1 Ig-like domain repeat protein [Microbacterium arthrosphaerae]MDW7605590.1 Ig-like domain repeat protein [Microbacterium sp. M3]
MAGYDVARGAAAPRRSARRWVAASVTIALTLFGVVAAPSFAQADGPTTFSNTSAIAIPAAGSADQTGEANPYPSAITVAGMNGAVTKVQVVFHDLSHASLGDVDAMVVAPTGANLVVLSDADQPSGSLTFSTNATLTFDDAAAGGVPTGNVPTGTYRPTNGSGPDSFPAPAPSPSAQTTLAGAFTGINPNGTWQLFIVDDATGDLGQMAGGWSLVITTEVAAVTTTTTVTTSGSPSTTGAPVTFTATVTGGGSPVTTGTVAFTADGVTIGGPVAVNASGTASLTTTALAEGTHLIVGTYSGSTGFLTSNGSVSQRVDNQTTVTGNTFCNTGPLTIPGQGASSPYPSNITVSGLTAPITNVTATLNGLSHQVPVDVDVMLSGPAPATNLVLMSDVGGTSAVSGATVTFADAAATAVPTPLVSGTFRPTDDDADVPDAAFPAPAPSPSGATALSTFDGASANGVWSLWVVDDASGDAGSISGGWCLTITTLSATTTALASSLNPSTFGQSVTFSATVTSGGAPVTAGSVVFADGATTLAAVPIDGAGQASLTTSALAVGTHAITANYSGTPDFGASDASLSQVVQVVPTATALSSSLNPSEVGDPVTFTAVVTAGGSPVTSGSVTFADGATTLATVAVGPTGTATFTTAALAAGAHAVSATYGGTAVFATSSAGLDQTVDVVPTLTALSSSLTPSEVGDPVTFTATVTAGGSPVMSGSITFAEGATTLATVTVDATGTATFTTDALAAGTHTISAAYSGTAALGASADDVEQSVLEPVVADAGGPYSVAEGGSLTLDGSGSTPEADYAWDLDADGDFTDASGPAPTLTWTQLEALGIDDGPSTHTIALRVTVGARAETATAVLDVVNTAPDAVVTGALTATAGVPFTIKVGADDPSAADMAADFVYTVDWGDGSAVITDTGPADPPYTHTYAAAGTYTATLTATDKDGGTSDPLTIQVVVAAAATPTPTPPSTTPPPARPAGGGGLPVTGADASAATLAAGILLLLGAALVAVGRRTARRTS